MDIQPKYTVEEFDALTSIRDHYARFVRQLVPHPEDMAREFEAYALLPENEDRILELIDREIVEKVPTNARASEVGAKIIYHIQHHLEINDIDGRVTMADGGFKVGTDRYAPDVAYLPASKQEELEGRGYNSVPPDLVVEIETNLTRESKETLFKKIVNYVNHGIVVWAIYPETEEIKVHVPDKEVVTLGIDDVLDGGDVLPGFHVPVKKIFKRKIEG